MNIVFRGPEFYCQEDEAAFFNWIESLPEFVNVTGEVKDLNLSLLEPISNTSVIQLLAIFMRWKIDSKALEKLRSKENYDHYLWN